MKNKQIKSLLLTCTFNAAILTTSSAFALENGTIPESNIPALAPGFEFSASALYLQPSSNNLDYAILTNPILPGSGPIVGALTPNWEKQYIDPDYQFGFNLGVRYILPNTKNEDGSIYDMALDWTHLNTSDSDSVIASKNNPVQFVGPDYQIGPDAGPIRSAQSNVKYNFDVVHMDFGIYKNYGNYVRTRFFGGLSGTHIKQTLTTTFAGNVLKSEEGLEEGLNDGPFSVTSENISKFTGVGPRLGANGTVYIGKSFGIIGEAAVSALIGTQKTEMNFASSSARLAKAGIDVNYQQIASESTTKVIPAIDTKLGLNYTRELSNNKSVAIELGYQAAIYINAIDEVFPTSLVTDPPTPLQTGTIAVNTMGESQSDFSVNGPYLKVSVKV
jgi:hypothetical protein